MITLNVPTRTARNLLEYINNFLDSNSNQEFAREAIEDKMRIKRAIGRAEGIPRSMLVDFRLDDMVKEKGGEYDN